MKFKRFFIATLPVALGLIIPIVAHGQPASSINQIYPKFYTAGGLIWKGESTQETNWKKIC